jgi:hypothetical protein
MTSEPTPPRGTITRSLLAVALLVLAGLIAWVGATRAASGQNLIVFGAALLPVVAAALLAVRPGIGATVAVVAALLGALFAFLLSICVLCPQQPPLSVEAIAFLVAALVIFGLAVIELRSLRLGWVLVPIAVVFFVVAGNYIAVGVILAVVIVWLLVRRLRSGGGAAAKQT